MIVAVTGHRPDKLGGWYTPNPVYTAVVERLRAALEELKPDYVITGMALGVDQWAAEVCVSMGIPFIAAVPFKGQESKWPPHSQARYQNLLSKSYKAYVISGGGYEASKMHIRNKWMVNEADILLAVWNGSNGGTSACVGYAQGVGKLIKWVNLTPELWALAAKMAPKKEVGGFQAMAIEATTSEPPGKTPLSPFIGQIKSKAEEQAKKQLLDAQEQAKLQQEWAMNTKMEKLAKVMKLKEVEDASKLALKKQKSIFTKLLEEEEEEKAKTPELKYHRVMDIDD